MANALTDEELKRHEDRSWLGIPMTPVTTRRLIAALHASRAETELQRSRAERALELRRENGRLQAEVERLKAEMDLLQERYEDARWQAMGENL